MGFLVLLLFSVCACHAVKNFSSVLRQQSHFTGETPFWTTTSDSKQEPDFEVYRSFGEIIDTLTNFEYRFPDKVIRETIGKSCESRLIEIVKVSSDHLASDRPIVFVIGNMHAREWATNAAILYSINKLLNGNPDVLQKVNFHFLPVANPDGYEFSRNGDPTDCSYTYDYNLRRPRFPARMWRKTRSRTNSTGCIGVDGNRNFPFMFGYETDESRSSIHPCTDTDRGENAESEPEVRAVANHLRTTRNVEAFVTVHAFGQLIMWPYGYKQNLTIDEQPQNLEELAKVANDMKKEMEGVNGNKYTSQVSSDAYPHSGSSLDFAKHIGVRLTFVIELPPKGPPSGPNGFCLPENQIRGASEELFAGLITVAEALSGARSCMSSFALVILVVGWLIG